MMDDGQLAARCLQCQSRGKACCAVAGEDHAAEVIKESSDHG
jgi:hypothetical protein